jgi:hypothetical protein
VHVDPQFVLVLALGPIIGWLMIESGLFKQMLERRRHDRVCPSCGRNAQSCFCAGA